MRLLASTDYALRVLMLLGRQETGQQLNVETIAGQLGGLSRNHLHKIVQVLAGLGLLKAVRGAGGGVSLAKPLDEIRLGWLIRMLEDDQPIVECFREDRGRCVIETGCRLRGKISTALDAFYRTLDQYTIADCVGGRWFAAIEQAPARNSGRGIGRAAVPPGRVRLRSSS